MGKICYSVSSSLSLTYLKHNLLSWLSFVINSIVPLPWQVWTQTELPLHTVSCGFHLLWYIYSEFGKGLGLKKIFSSLQIISLVMVSIGVYARTVKHAGKWSSTDPLPLFSVGILHVRTVRVLSEALNKQCSGKKASCVVLNVLIEMDNNKKRFLLVFRKGQIHPQKRQTTLFRRVFELFSFASEAALACLAVDPAIMLMVVGIFIFIVTFCGCVGSLRENICLLQTVSFSAAGL